MAIVPGRALFYIPRHMNQIPDPNTLQLPEAPPGLGQLKPLNTRWDRFSAWMNMIFIDHAFFRMAYLNLHRLAGDAWRSAQPLPYQVTRLARTQGLKTVISLRGGRGFGSLPLEIEACRNSGVHFEVFGMRSRALPTPEEIVEIDQLFRRLEYPVLFHCKSGADRAGMISTLFMILREGKPVREAKNQLSMKFGHIRHGKTGVLDALFETYLADQPDEAIAFLEWSQTHYDPDAIAAQFQSGGIGNLLTERLLRRE